MSWVSVRSLVAVGLTVVLHLGLASLGSGTPTSPEDTCTVPGSHSTIQDAVQDVNCSEIHLTGTMYAESIRIRRSLTIVGQGQPGTTIEGRLHADGADTVVVLEDLKIENGCEPEAMIAVGGADVEGSNLVVTRAAGLPCPPVAETPIFSNGFESGDTSAWSQTVP